MCGVCSQSPTCATAWSVEAPRSNSVHVKYALLASIPVCPQTPFPGQCMCPPTLHNGAPLIGTLQSRPYQSSAASPRKTWRDSPGPGIERSDLLPLRWEHLNFQCHLAPHIGHEPMGQGLAQCPSLLHLKQGPGGSVEHPSVFLFWSPWKAEANWQLAWPSFNFGVFLIAPLYYWRPWRQLLWGLFVRCMAYLLIFLAFIWYLGMSGKQNEYEIEFPHLWLWI